MSPAAIYWLRRPENLSGAPNHRLRSSASITRRLMIAGVACLLAAQSAIVLDAAADQISIEQRSLDAEIAGVPAELRTRFDELYRDWRTTWERPDIRVSSNSKAVKDSDEFRAVVFLGRKSSSSTAANASKR